MRYCLIKACASFFRYDAIMAHLIGYSIMETYLYMHWETKKCM